MFSRFFIYRPIFASVISIVIVIVGLISSPLLPVESMPNITPPIPPISGDINSSRRHNLRLLREEFDGEAVIH